MSVTSRPASWTAAEQASTARPSVLLPEFLLISVMPIPAMAALSWLFPFRALYVADSDEQAQEEAVPAALEEWTKFYKTRARLNAADPQLRNPTELVKSMTKGSGLFDSDPTVEGPEHASKLLVEKRLVAGSPKYVAERIAEERDTGFKNLLFPMSLTGIPEEKVAHSMRLFAEEVAPLFKD